MAKKIDLIKKPKWKIKKGDKVQVISGRSKSKVGEVKKVLPRKGRLIIEGVNIISKHTKPDANNPDGGIIKKEAPIDISNVVLLDPKTNKPTKVGRKLVDGKLVRFAKKTGEVIK